MTSRSTPRLFISHSSKDKELVRLLVNVLGEALDLTRDRIACSTVEGCAFASGEPIEGEVVDAAIRAKSFIAVLSRQSAESDWVRFEIGVRWGRRKSLRLLSVPGCSLESFGQPITGRVIASAEKRSDLLRLIKEISEQDLGRWWWSRVWPGNYEEQLAAFSSAIQQSRIAEESRDGNVTREELLRSNEKLHGEVFAIEMLERPVVIVRKPNGDLGVKVNRSDVRTVVISNPGKTAEVTRIIGKHNRQEIEDHDRELQEFLAGDTVGAKSTDPAGIRLPLRWASGGVLSIVKRNGEWWIPFFFRDIRPYGWNISLGQTERPFNGNQLRDEYRLIEEWKHPLQYILREFKEESLILNGDPADPLVANLKLIRLSIKNGSAYDGDHDREHIDKRREYDRLEIGLPDAHDLRDACDMTDDVAPWSRLEVIRDDEMEPTKHVLVCFSLLDLGIEVVKVFRYALNAHETMLDGEIIDVPDPKPGEPKRQLVRMPMALMSLQYLQRTFGERTDWQRYTVGPQPSIEIPADAAPKPEEIELFSQDVKRRMEIIKEGGTSFEQNRYLNWYDSFRENFLAEDGKTPSCAKPSRLFVPGTAKILNLLFSAMAALPTDEQKRILA